MKTRKSLQDKAMLAMKEAIKEVVKRHKKSGRPLAVWKDGKVKRITYHRVGGKFTLRTGALRKRVTSRRST